jgi:hypothetical protein
MRGIHVIWYWVETIIFESTFGIFLELLLMSRLIEHKKFSSLVLPRQKLVSQS